MPSTALILRYGSLALQKIVYKLLALRQAFTKRVDCGPIEATFVAKIDLLYRNNILRRSEADHIFLLIDKLRLIVILL